MKYPVDKIILMYLYMYKIVEGENFGEPYR